MKYNIEVIKGNVRLKVEDSGKEIGNLIFEE